MFLSPSKIAECRELLVKQIFKELIVVISYAEFRTVILISLYSMVSHQVPLRRHFFTTLQKIYE